MIQKIHRKIISFTSLFLFLFSYQKTLAQFDTSRTGVTVRLQDPTGNNTSVSQLITLFVDWIIQLGTVAVVLAFVYVGFQFVAAKGNPEGIQKAKTSFMWTVIGTIVLIGARVLTEVIKNTLTQGGVITA
jgi:heme/copper-type cytochrome/quinol oxidase subunit 2